MAIPQHLCVAPGPLEPLRQDVPGFRGHVPWRHIEFLQLEPHGLGRLRGPRGPRGQPGNPVNGTQGLTEIAG